MLIGVSKNIDIMFSEYYKTQTIPYRFVFFSDYYYNI